MEQIALKIIYYLLLIIGFLSALITLLMAIDRLIISIIKRMDMFPALYDFLIDRSRKKFLKK